MTLVLARYGVPKLHTWPNYFLCFMLVPSRVHLQELLPLVRRALIHHFVIRKNVFIFHANLAKLTLEGRLIANRVAMLFIIKMCFHCKFFILIFKTQGHTCPFILLHVTSIDSSLVGWSSKTYTWSCHNWKHNNKIPTSICNFVINNKL
jgi:hypothetical protein